MKALVPRIVNVGLVVTDSGIEVAAILVFGSDAFGVFFELRRIVGLCEQVFQKYRVRYADRAQVLHGLAKNSALDGVVALELDLADLDLGTFFHNKNNAYRGWRNLPHLAANRS